MADEHRVRRVVGRHGGGVATQDGGEVVLHDLAGAACGEISRG